jgi:probable HAF family extracellular repeat protein
MSLHSRPMQLVISLTFLCIVPACSSGVAHPPSGASMMPADARFASPDFRLSFNEITLPGGRYALASALNNRGAIGGTYYDSNSVRHGFVFLDGVLTNVDHPRAVNTQVFGINDQGDIVGTYTLRSGHSRGFLFSHGSYRDIGLGVRSGATAINNAGQIVGVYNDCAKVCATHGFRFDGQAYTTFDVPNSTDTAPAGINDAGVVTLNARDQRAVSHAYLYDGKTFANIDMPGKSESFAYGINVDGDVALRWFGSNETTGAAVLHKGKYNPFNYPGAVATQLGALNDHRVAVGTYFAPINQTGIFTVKY